jgi:hypothetical protein
VAETLKQSTRSVLEEAMKVLVKITEVCMEACECYI